MAAEASGWAALKGAGNELYAKKDFKGASAKYTEALAAEDLGAEDRATLLSNRAQCYIKMGEHAAAAEDCTAALELNDKNVKALFRRAVSREAMGDKAGALADHRAVLAAQPGQEGSRSAVARLDPSAAAAAPSASGRGRRGKKLSREEVAALQEAQAEALQAQRSVQQARQRADVLARRQRMSALTRSEVSKAPADGVMYRHVGKMFVRVPQAEHLRALDAEKAELDKQQAALARLGEGFEAKAKTANDTLRSLANAAGITVAVPGDSA